MAEKQHQERFRVALQRLTREIDAVRNELAATSACREGRPSSNLFVALAFEALLGDRLIRLVRIFEDEKDAASFWYLYRCAPQRMKNLDLERLRKFSGKLKTVRYLIFAHLDKKGTFDPLAIWEVAGATDSDVAHAVEIVRRALYNLSVEEFGRAPISSYDDEASESYRPDFDSLKRRVKKSIAKLSATNQSVMP